MSNLPEMARITVDVGGFYFQNKSISHHIEIDCRKCCILDAASWLKKEKKIKILLITLDGCHGLLRQHDTSINDIF